ncbi:magnesium-dependent phosphatase 1-like [Tribolium madens]|uniref:magnesium-dependent phosphatase 1-like n=1 Tax=Tribolium madens TaxID=41895 RepID=UPI001CF7243C|nr:magnesium-dependent phosphatase 1-like [Tribolium madens]
MANVIEVKPKILVFDLDYTLWPFWVDTHVIPPFRKTNDGCVIDQFGSKIQYYNDVPELLQELYLEGYILAVASRTSEVEGARQLLDLFGWTKYFSHLEIFTGVKTKHITRIKNKFDVEYSEMIFFDDESRNIRDVSKLGVLSILVNNGISRKVVDDAIEQFTKQSKRK